MKYEFDNGKYTVVSEDGTGKQYALRHGEPWRDLTGDNLIYWMMVEIRVLHDALSKAAGDDAEAVKAYIEAVR